MFVKNRLPLILLLALLSGRGPLSGASLDSAARHGETAEVRKLLDQGADPNAISGNLLLPRLTPLLEAAMNGHPDTLALLLDRGAKLEMTTPGSNGMTALMMAAFHGQADAVKLLIARGANLHTVSRPFHKGFLMAARSGKTALQWARERRNDDCVSLLEQAEKDEPQKLLLARQAAEQLARETAMGRHPNPVTLAAEEKIAEAAVQAGKFNEALDHFTAALRAASNGSEADERLRRKSIQTFLAMQPPPAIPEEATHHALRGKAFMELAQDVEGYKKAEFELELAVEFAPWWADAYFNLGLIEEKVNDFKGASRDLNLYLLAAPGSPDASAVRQKIIKLEVKQELKEGK